MSSKHGHSQCLTDMLLTAVTGSLAGVGWSVETSFTGRRCKQAVYVLWGVGVASLLAKMEGIL